MYTYVLSFSDGFFKQIVIHDKRFTTEEFQALVRSIPDMPKGYDKDGWFGGWVCKWHAEYLVENHGFTIDGFMEIDLLGYGDTYETFVDKNERKAIKFGNL